MSFDILSSFYRATKACRIVNSLSLSKNDKGMSPDIPSSHFHIFRKVHENLSIRPMSLQKTKKKKYLKR